MSACVFLGPSLPLAEASRVFDAIYLPPVRQGDVYRAVRQWRPQTIAIVDGYFQQVPSVWHKEILWAMERGVRVAGSASMGALRAAELDMFGMIGVGKIFDAYRTGCLEPYMTTFEDDDEVAVIHGPPETGYLAVSEAMVNIRVTLAKAHRAGVVSLQSRDRLVECAKRTHYPERSFELLIERAEDLNVPPDEISALGRWLAQGRVDQKREDALALLEQLRDVAGLEPGPSATVPPFEVTEIWADAVHAMDEEVRVETAGRCSAEIIDELRLEGSRYFEARTQALARMAMLTRAGTSAEAVDSGELRSASDRLRRARGLLDRVAVDAWLADNELGLEQYDRLVEDEVRLERLRPTLDDALTPHLIDHLRVRGDYGRLAERARRKRELLAGEGPVAGGMAGPAPSDGQPGSTELLAWYFEQQLGSAVPDDINLHSTRLGYPHTDDFLRALAREFAYVTRRGRDGLGRERAAHDGD